MTWTVATFELDGTPVSADLPIGDFSFTHSLDGPGSFEAAFSMHNIARDDIEPGQRDYKVFDGATLRAEGRIWIARVDTNANRLSGKLIGEGLGGILRRRGIDWEVRYEKVTETPTNLNTSYGLSQEEVVWDLIDRSQAETGGDLGLTQGTHTGGSHLRRAWYCVEDGLFISDVLDEYAALSDGIDWAITPTLTDASSRAFVTFNPSRGSDLSGSVTLDGTQYLDTLSYEIDAGQIVSRGHAVGSGDCDPPVGDWPDASALATYGLLEDFDSVDSDDQDDADERAQALISDTPVVGSDVWYELSSGPALGTFDVGDIITLQSSRPGWELDIPVRVQEIEVSVQMPDNVFVRVNWAMVGDVGS